MRRIQRDTRYEELVKRLTTGDSAVFKEIWRLLLFSAALGIRDGTRKPLEQVDSGKAMPESYFSTPGWRGLLYLIGVAETGESECLRGDSDQQDLLITIFEEYANQGLCILEERMQSAVVPLDELVGLLTSVSTDERIRPDVADLI